jgi:hypothetical protein
MSHHLSLFFLLSINSKSIYIIIILKSYSYVRGYQLVLKIFVLYSDDITVDVKHFHVKRIY